MKLISLLFLLTACASVQSEAKWYEVAPAYEKQKWRLCIKELDGEVKHLKGLCYISKECKDYRKFLIKKTTCRPKPLYCPFTAIDCLSKHAYSGKVLTKRR